MSETIAYHLRIGDSHPCVMFGVMDKLILHVLLSSTFIARFKKPVHPAQVKIASSHSPLVLILLVLATRSEHENKEQSNIRQANTEGLALLVTPTENEPKHITAARQEVLKVMCDTSALVSTGAAGLLEVISHNIAVIIYACMTAKGNMDIYPGRLFYIAISNVGTVDVQLPNLKSLVKSHVRQCK